LNNKNNYIYKLTVDDVVYAIIKYPVIIVFVLLCILGMYLLKKTGVSEYAFLYILVKTLVAFLVADIIWKLRFSGLVGSMEIWKNYVLSKNDNSRIDDMIYFLGVMIFRGMLYLAIIIGVILCGGM